MVRRNGVGSLLVTSWTPPSSVISISSIQTNLGGRQGASVGGGAPVTPTPTPVGALAHLWALAHLCLVPLRSRGHIVAHCSHCSLPADQNSLALG